MSKLPMDSNYEIDYAVIIAGMKKQLDDALAEQNLYFDLLGKLNELTIYSNLIAKRMMELPIHEQLPLVQATVQSCLISKEICDRHGWVPEDCEVQDD